MTLQRGDGMAEKKKYRRSNGEGSIFRRSNGKWCGQIGLGYDINGIRKRKTVFGSTRAEVAKKLIELQGVINAKNLIPNDNTTLGQFMNEWLKDFKRPTVSPRTYEWYLNIEKSISDVMRIYTARTGGNHKVYGGVNPHSYM